MSNTGNSPKSTDNLFAGVLKSAPTDQSPDPAVGSPTAPDGSADTDGAPANEASEANEAPQMISELDMLKSRAKLMGIVFSNNIGVDALRAKIQAKLDGEKEAPTPADPTPNAHPLDHDGDGKPGGSVTAEQVAAAKPAKTKRQLMIEEQMKLVRLRITNLDPKKKDLPGEIFTFANRILGAVRKYIPYGEATENGYHVPYCIYQQLKEREFLNIKTRKNSRGQTIVETGMAREFALEVLPPLTERELAKLAASQAAAKGMD